MPPSKKKLPIPPGHFLLFPVIALLAGMLVAHYQLPPYVFYENALDYLAAYGKKLEGEQAEGAAREKILKEERGAVTASKPHKRQIKGSVVTVHKPEKSYNGLTLINLADFSRAALLDMKGNTVHSWELPNSKVFSKSMHKKRTCKDWRIIWSAMHLYPNGDLLAIYHCRNHNPSGHGLVRVDRNSKLLWKVRMQAHHDIIVGPEGNIYTLNLLDSEKPRPEYPNIRYPYTREYLIIFSPEGKLLKKTDLLAALLPVNGNELIKSSDGYRKRDYIHTNSIDILTPELAPAFPQFKEGDILLSMRNLSMLVVLDSKTHKAKWTKHGAWSMQHYARFQPNGTIQLFDNRGAYSEQGQYSRILEIDPETANIAWQFSGNANNLLHTQVRGSQQTLPNNNILINSARQGRLLEITRDGEIVWEFRYFDKPLEHHPLDVIVTAIRFKPEELPFLQQVQ